MKRVSILLAGALAMGASAAVAGINPLSPGLPVNYTMTSTVGFGAITVSGNPASAMCVECHTVNPSGHVLAPAEKGVYGGANTYVNRANETNWGSHTVANNLMGTAGVLKGYTHSGGGFTGGYGTQPRVAGEYMAKVAWAATGDSGGVSKYGDPTAAGAVGHKFAVTGTPAVAWGSEDPDMICESCHNILRNVANPAHATSPIVNKLLLGRYDDNGEDALCVVCHDGGADNAASYSAFHGNDNLVAFNGTSRKRHHVLTGDDFSNYGTTGYGSTMWAPSFSDKLSSSWCGSSGRYTKIASPTALATSEKIQFRGACNVSGVGTLSNTALIGDIGNIGTATNVKCTNCHRAHNAKTASGAFVFRIGTTTSNDDFPGSVGSLSGVSLTGANAWRAGIRRQYDTGLDWSTIGGTMYGEYVKLCVGCHQGYQ